MIIIPYNHDKMQFQRLPFVTIGLILLNILIFIITCIEVNKTLDAANNKAKEIFIFYSEHPELEIPEETVLKISPEWLAEIQAQKSVTGIMGDEYMSEDPDPEDQEHLNTLVEEFEHAISNLFYRKYGYIPATGGFLPMISSIFIHGGFFHLIFNMLFLWLAGGILEDLWGRMVFPAFYILGGIIATLAHASAYPQSSQPLIGASGAIAALMGAFMIRQYKTKIKMFYAIFFVVRFRYGTFKSPAYLVLPIWLLQQVWDYYMYSNSSDVAFLSHIGGFAFGAGFAVLLKISRIEKDLIEPLVEMKSDLLDKNLSLGEEKLLSGEAEEAAHNLRLAISKNPKDPMAHSQLCKAYFLQSKQRVALVEMNRAIALYFEFEYFDNATDFYLEITNEFDGTILEPPLQMKIASIFMEKENYTMAAAAYEKLFCHYLPDSGPLEHPEAIKALKTYADICYHHLAQPDNACSSYKRLLEYKTYLSEKQISSVEKKIQQVEASISNPVPTAPAKEKNKDNDLLRNLNKKIKLTDKIRTPSKYDVPSLIPQETGNIGPAEKGLDLRLLNEKKILFSDINYLCIFQLTEKPDILYADIFICGESRPYRILSSQVTYRKFLTKLDQIQLNNFHRFILYIISQMDSIYIDKKALQYLRTKKPPKYPSQDHIKQHEKAIWTKLKGKQHAGCLNCNEFYWFDGEKIPTTGAKTKCKKCGHIIKIKPLKKSNSENTDQIHPDAKNMNSRIPLVQT